MTNGREDFHSSFVIRISSFTLHSSHLHPQPPSLPEPPERQLAANGRIRDHGEPGPVDAEAEAGERDSREWQWNLVPGEEAGEGDADADQADEGDGEGN